MHDVHLRSAPCSHFSLLHLFFRTADSPQLLCMMSSGRPRLTPASMHDVIRPTGVLLGGRGCSVASFSFLVYLSSICYSFILFCPAPLHFFLVQASPLLANCLSSPLPLPLPPLPLSPFPLPPFPSSPFPLTLPLPPFVCLRGGGGGGGGKWPHRSGTSNLRIAIIQMLNASSSYFIDLDHEHVSSCF